MSANNEPVAAKPEGEKPTGEHGNKETDLDSSTADTNSQKSGIDILALQSLDPALNAKMHLVNDAIDEIGWTPYHWKLFVLNGFGYAVDSLILLFQSIIAGNAYKEFGSVGYENGLTIAAYVGMLSGAIFWGFSADMIGRRWAFNISLFICSVSCVLAGAMPSWPSLGVFVALIGFGGGGNLILDTTVFLEYLPGPKQWVLTLLACWWGVGQAIAGFIAWGFLSPDEWNCDLSGPVCRREDNWGWRYVLFTGGAAVFVMSVLRVTIIRLKETPKYLLSLGHDERIVETLQSIAQKYGRTCSLTTEKLEACGRVQTAKDKGRVSVSEIAVHLRGLFYTRKLVLSTLLVWLSWTLIGLVYPLFYVFLPVYLRNRGVLFDRTEYETWRNYAFVNISGIPSPMLAGLMCNQPWLGRRYTMVVGALLGMAFFFGYTGVETDAQDIVMNCLIAFSINIYYGTLYAYTPEVLPSAHRATGNGISVSLNRIMGIMSAVIATEADTSTPAPIYICAALFVAMAIVAASFPFEPYGKRSS